MRKRLESLVLNSRGQVLAGVVMLLLVMLIIVPAMVQWVQNETRASVKTQRATTAFNLAQAAVERGYWKCQSSTATWKAISAGVVQTGYDFDQTYTDIDGGTYRISISSVGISSVTVIGEGRDAQSKETRAITAVFQNQTIYSPLMANGNITLTRGLVTFWGPIMAQGNITIADDSIGALYYPLKYAKGTVIGTAANPRDTNGLTPPNTDSLEWWSGYQYVPPLPIIDFAALRSSAAAAGTLNVYGCKGNTTSYTSSTGTYLNAAAPWDTRTSCGSTAPHTTHFGYSANHSKSAINEVSVSTEVWYYDGDVTLSGTLGSPSKGAGLRGTLIVLGNLTIDSPGQYSYTGPMPTYAWQQHAQSTKGTLDSASTGQYPGDTGLRSNSSTFVFGPTNTFCLYPASCGVYSTPGFRGFVYVGGNLIISNASMDFNGAVWVKGAVVSSGTGLTNACGVFYDDTLDVPTLNVILVRQSWKETSPSNRAWP